MTPTPALPPLLNMAILEDNDLVREELISFLSRPGRRVSGFGTAAALWAHLLDDVPHITLLDLGLPDMDGLDVARRLRQAHPGMGLIILSARTHANDRSHGYENGADIFLTKPTNVRELEAVVQNLADRVLRSLAPEPEFELRTKALCLRKLGGDWVDLTPLEVQLLTTLARAPQRELSTQALVDALQACHPCSPAKKPLDASAGRDNLAVLISRLRTKLHGDGATLIKAIRGHGYRLTALVRVMD